MKASKQYIGLKKVIFRIIHDMVTATDTAPLRVIGDLEMAMLQGGTSQAQHAPLHTDVVHVRIVNHLRVIRCMDSVWTVWMCTVLNSVF